jgi:hypothetical protein
MATENEGDAGQSQPAAQLPLGQSSCPPNGLQATTSQTSRTLSASDKLVTETCGPSLQARRARDAAALGWGTWHTSYLGTHVCRRQHQDHVNIHKLKGLHGNLGSCTAAMGRAVVRRGAADAEDKRVVREAEGWVCRPLAPALLRYAALDVLTNLALYQRMRACGLMELLRGQSAGGIQAIRRVVLPGCPQQG